MVNILQSTILLFFSCTLLCCIRPISSEDGGSGTEVIGRQSTGIHSFNHKILAHSAYASSQKPAIQSHMYLFPETFQADTNRTFQSYQPRDITSSNGKGEIKNIIRGSYILEVTDAKGYSIAKRFSLNSKSDASIQKLLLRPTASLTCSIVAPSSRHPFYVYILGTRYSKKGDATSNTVSLSHLPTGTPFTILVEGKHPHNWKQVFDKISLVPGEETKLEVHIPNSISTK